MTIEFPEFRKIPRLNREVVVTEKIDGTNGVIDIRLLGEASPLDGVDTAVVDIEGRFHVLRVGSRTRWIGRHTDNHGFANWALDHASELAKLGPGTHHGEWWGKGIQRGYGLTEKRFSLFNTHKWSDPAVRPACCHVVPVLMTCNFNSDLIRICLADLTVNGSYAAPGFMKPEGVIVYHTAANSYFKATLCKDEEPKSKAAA